MSLAPDGYPDGGYAYVERLTRERDEAKAEIARLRPVTEAARALVSALDYSDPSWRTETLGAGKNGDEVNEAWDALIAALEGKP